MFYFILLKFLYPIRLFFSLKSTRCKKNLIIQTAKIGDYVNTSCLFNELSNEVNKLDLVIDRSVESLAKKDPRVDSVFIINIYKINVFMKLKLGLILLRQRYDQVIVVLPNQLNLFLGVFCWPNYNVTVIPYRASVSLKALTNSYDRLVLHSRNDLTIQTYSKCLRSFDGKYYKKSLILNNKGNFNKYFSTNKKKAGVAISSGSAWKNIPVDEWNWIFYDLHNNGFEIFVIGSAADIKRVDEVISISTFNIINLTGCIALEDLPTLISNFTLLIGSDTGAIYIADAINIPTIVYAGPCHMQEQRPTGKCLIVEPKDLGGIRKSYIFDSLKSGDYSELYFTDQEQRVLISKFIKNLSF